MPGLDLSLAPELRHHVRMNVDAMLVDHGATLLAQHNQVNECATSANSRSPLRSDKNGRCDELPFPHADG
jgi:hypothetical protein